MNWLLREKKFEGIREIKRKEKNTDVIKGCFFRSEWLLNLGGNDQIGEIIKGLVRNRWQGIKHSWRKMYGNDIRVKVLMKPAFVNVSLGFWDSNQKGIFMVSNVDFR